MDNFVTDSQIDLDSAYATFGNERPVSQEELFAADVLSTSIGIETVQIDTASLLVNNEDEEPWNEDDYKNPHIPCDYPECKCGLFKDDEKYIYTDHGGILQYVPAELRTPESTQILNNSFDSSPASPLIRPPDPDQILPGKSEIYAGKFKIKNHGNGRFALKAKSINDKWNKVSIFVINTNKLRFLGILVREKKLKILSLNAGNTKWKALLSIAAPKKKLLVRYFQTR